MMKKYRVKISNFTFGVPASIFAYKYNAEQFELLGATESEGAGFARGIYDETSTIKQALVNSEKVYKRLFIRNKFNS